MGPIRIKTKLKVTLFLDVTSCSLVDVNRGFCCPHLRDRRVKWSVGGYKDTDGLHRNFYEQTEAMRTGQHVPAIRGITRTRLQASQPRTHSDAHSHSRENLKSHKIKFPQQLSV
jgi:hypothetical protein